MSEMIKRVARALCAKVDGKKPDRVITMRNARVFAWQLYVDDAVIAIEAMREPSVAMMVAGRGYCDSLHNARSAFRAMIEAALQEKHDEHAQS